MIINLFGKKKLTKSVLQPQAFSGYNSPVGSSWIGSISGASSFSGQIQTSEHIKKWKKLMKGEKEK